MGSSISKVVGSVVDPFGACGGDDASDAGKKASKTQAQYQQQALDYLKETEKIPQALRESALQKLGSVYGIAYEPEPVSVDTLIGKLGLDPRRHQAMTQDLEFRNLLEQLREGEYTGATDTESIKNRLREMGIPEKAIRAMGGLDVLLADLREGEYKTEAPMYGTAGQQDLIDQARMSPLYGAIMGGRKEGEEAIMRQAAATGGLRSGNIQEALYDYNTQLQNQALLQSYNEQLAGLTGLSRLPSQAPQIAQQTSAIGQTLGMGIVGAEQARQTALQQGLGNIMGFGTLAASVFSDRRLKDNIKKIGESNGLNVYSWTWNKIANGFGLFGSSRGAMADEVKEVCPDAVSTHESGYLMVNYNLI